MTKAWCIEPTSNNILVREMEGSIFQESKKKYNWKMAETMTFTHTNGNNYMLLMNDMGMYEDTEPNMCATKLLKRLSINWGVKVLTGNFVICRFEDNGEETLYYDMDLTPKEFVAGFKQSRK